MAKSRGLGKGLDALFQIQEEVEVEQPIDRKEENKSKNIGVSKIDIKLIDPNKQQPRREFNEDSIKELAQSIKQHGVLQPIVLKPKGNRYVIVAGERRWRASKLAGVKEIPANVYNLTDQEAMEIALIENLQREDLNVIEEALGIDQLIKQCNMTQEKAAERLGKSRSAIANVLRLLALPHETKQLVLDNKISAGHARALLGLKSKEDIKDVSEEIIEQELNVRETEQRVKTYYDIEEPAKQNEPIEKSIYIKDLEEQLKDKFETKVSINLKDNKKIIQIECYSDEEFNKIVEELL